MAQGARVPGRERAATQSLAQQQEVQRPATGQVMRTMRMHRMEPSALAQLPNEAAPSIGEVANGGQAFIENLEAQLKSTQGRISVERQVVHAINNPHAVFLPAGNAETNMKQIHC